MIFINTIEIRIKNYIKKFIVSRYIHLMHIYFFDRKKIFSKLTFSKNCNSKIIIYLNNTNNTNNIYIKKLF